MNPWSIYFVYGGAAGMVAAVVLVIWRYKATKELSIKSLLWLLYILAAMSIMFGGAAAYYLASPNTDNLFTAILIANVSMIAWLVFLSGNTGSDRVIDRKLSTVAVAVGGALIGEILMGGITYTLYFNGASNDLLLRSLNSPWFIVPMTVEAGISYALNKRNGGLLSKIAPLWIINMLFNPPIMMGSYWFELSLSASAIIMTITIIIMLDYLHRHKVIHDHDIHVFVGASIVMAIMMLVQLLAYIGFIPWISYGAAVLVDMAWYFVVYLNDDLMGGRTSWLTKPVILALSLSAIFVAEAAMGGVISMEAGWLDVIQLKSLLNPPISVIGSIEFISSLSLSRVS